MRPAPRRRLARRASVLHDRQTAGKAVLRVEDR
jgi:hypothetical protein